MKLEHVLGIFSTKTPDGTAEVHYRIKDNVMQIYYTYGPKQDHRKIFVEDLIKAAFDFARGNSYCVKPECPEAQAFVEQYKRYENVAKVVV